MPFARLSVPSLASDRRRRLRDSARIHHLGRMCTCFRPYPTTRCPAFCTPLTCSSFPSVTILPDHREQFGRVLIEAMAAGVAVVGSSSGAIPEVIGDAGLVVPERDPAALANAIHQHTHG